MLLIEVTGDDDTFEAAALPSIAGVLYDDHAARPLDDGTWAVDVYVSDQTVVTAIQATGLTVTVLQTADEVQAELADIAGTFTGGATS